MPTANRILKTQIRDVYDRNIKNFWIQGYGEPEHEYEQFYSEMNITTEDERWSYMSGLGRWQQKEFGGNVSYDGIYQGYDTTITPYEYTLGFQVEQATVEDDPHGLLTSDLATNLAQTGRETLEYLAAVPFNSPTSTTGFSPWMSGGDGVALLSTSHPVLSGGVWANTPSSHVDLSVSALQAARTRMEKVKNARGFQFRMEPEKLVVPIDSRWIMDEILGSATLPYVAKTDTPNTVRNGLTGVVWSQLTDTDCWFLLARKGKSKGDKGHQLKCVMRIAPQFDRDNEFESGDRKYKGRMRVGFGYPDARGVDGSTGI